MNAVTDERLRELLDNLRRDLNAPTQLVSNNLAALRDHIALCDELLQRRAAEALLERLQSDGGRYLLSIALTREEFVAQPAPTFGGKGHSRWLTEAEHAALCTALSDYTALAQRCAELERELAVARADVAKPKYHQFNPAAPPSEQKPPEVGT